MFINYEQVIRLIHNEANYAASILSSCKPYVFVNGKENDVISVMVKFSRTNLYQCFQIEISCDANYLYSEIESKIKYNCKFAIMRLIDISYGKIS